ncbi:hypothetical protein CYY_001453 [Polysphondylium violaceum]|uniref:Uncharacterized protein n=1 Tax=Polysphondylium violaceum TaxID=133409 RepID=A0A8J4VAL0_9MYCE|nr:hypothetical protein CYY_001453 [Polysphondylium violaceum]
MATTNSSGSCNVKKDPIMLYKNIDQLCKSINCVGKCLSQIINLYISTPFPSISSAELQETLNRFENETSQSIIDKKIEFDDKKTWSACSSDFFSRIQEMKSILNMSTTDVNVKQQNLNNYLLSLCKSSSNLSNYCKRQPLVNEILDIYIQTIVIQGICITALNAFHTTLDNQVNIESLKEEYHHVMIDCLKTAITATTTTTTKVNMDNAVGALLQSNCILYPAPLVAAPLNIPSAELKFNRTYSTPTHWVPDIQGEFIYRIDGANMLPDQYQEDLFSTRPMPNIDPFTKCYGTCIHLTNAINIRLTRKRNIALRIFGIYPKAIGNLTIGSDIKLKRLDCVQRVFPCIPIAFKSADATSFPEYCESTGARSGYTFTHTVKNVDTLLLEIGQEVKQQLQQQQQQDKGNIGVVKFIELIITDVSKQDVDMYNDRKSNYKRLLEQVDSIYDKLNRGIEINPEETKLLQNHTQLLSTLEDDALL